MQMTQKKKKKTFFKHLAVKSHEDLQIKMFCKTGFFGEKHLPNSPHFKGGKKGWICHI